MMNAGAANSMCRSWNIAVSFKKWKRRKKKKIPCMCFFDHEVMQTHEQHEANLLVAEREDSETQNGV